MEYPKKIMKKSELKTLGFTEQYLQMAYRTKGQQFAWKLNPKAHNSPILFDTSEFDKWRMAQLRTENQSLQRG